MVKIKNNMNNNKTNNNIYSKKIFNFKQISMLNKRIIKI